MSKNNYILQKEKQIAELRKKVTIDSAYIGAGFIIALSELNYDQDTIYGIMEKVNSIWPELMEKGVNPLQYCYELTGIQVLVDEHEQEIVNKYFE